MLLVAIISFHSYLKVPRYLPTEYAILMKLPLVPLPHFFFTRRASSASGQGKVPKYLGTDSTGYHLHS